MRKINIMLVTMLPKISQCHERHYVEVEVGKILIFPTLLCDGAPIDLGAP